MTNKKQFELNPHDIDLIQKCLRREVGTVANRAHNNRHPQHTEAKANLDLIQSILGKLHNQKTWHVETGKLASVLSG